MMLVRRDIWALSDEDPWHPVILAYARAVGVLQKRPASNPTSWTFQAARHAGGNGIVPGGTNQQCQHRSWFFLPWHRIYLYYFERILRSTMPEVEGPADFALPYWNYARTVQSACLPPAFREPTLPNSSDPNPLFVNPRDRAGRMNGGRPLPPEVVSPSQALRTPRFEAGTRLGFGGGDPGRAHMGASSGQLERTPHNDVHNQVGGLMLDPRTAALDPIFWLHHANIDRIWEQWRAAPVNGRNPVAGGWKNEAFEFHDEHGNLVNPPLTAGQAEHTIAQLGYRYDDQPETPVDESPRDDDIELESFEPQRLAGASDDGLRLTGQRAAVRLTVPEETRDAVEGVAANQGTVSVRVEYVEAERNPETVYGVYLQAPDEDPIHIGNLSLFGIEVWNDLDRDEHGEDGFRFDYDVTREVEELAARGHWSPGSIEVVFEPIGVSDTEAEGDQELARADDEPIGIGRVSLFIG